MQPTVESFSWKAFALVVVACLLPALYAIFFFVSWTGPGRSYEICFSAKEEGWVLRVSDFDLGVLESVPSAVWLTIGSHPVIATQGDKTYLGVVLIDDFAQPEFRWDATLLAPPLVVTSCDRPLESILN